MRHEKHFPDFIYTTDLFLLLAGLFIWAFVNLMILENAPAAESLVFEECTFERYEIVNDSKTICYFLYVEEYEKPLEIDSIVVGVIDRDTLREVGSGDTIVVSKYEGKKSFPLYALSYGNKAILAYEDYLTEHDGNNSLGIWITGIFSLLMVILLIANTIHYKQTGRPLSWRGVRVSF
jgi:hypothetical protein